MIREKGARLDGLDPASPLDDLQLLGDLVGAARVVGIGESLHYASTSSRGSVTGCCGFTAFALESGFSEGFALDEWVQGVGDTSVLDRLAESSIPSGTARPRTVRDTLRWIRGHNRTDTAPVHFVGIDVPQAAGSLLPSFTRCASTSTWSTPTASSCSTLPSNSPRQSAGR